MPRDKENAFPMQAWENSQACSSIFEASPPAGNKKLDMPATRKEAPMCDSPRDAEGTAAVRGAEHPPGTLLAGTGTVLRAASCLKQRRGCGPRGLL